MISRKYNGKSNVIGDTLKNLRKSKKLSRAALSNKLMLLGIDINSDGIYKIEKGRRILKDFELTAIAMVLEVSEVELLSSFRKELKNVIWFHIIPACKAKIENKTHKKSAINPIVMTGLIFLFFNCEVYKAMTYRVVSVEPIMQEVSKPISVSTP